MEGKFLNHGALDSIHPADMSPCRTRWEIRLVSTEITTAHGAFAAHTDRVLEDLASIASDSNRLRPYGARVNGEAPIGPPAFFPPKAGGLLRTILGSRCRRRFSNGQARQAVRHHACRLRIRPRTARLSILPPSADHPCRQCQQWRNLK